MHAMTQCTQCRNAHNIAMHTMLQCTQCRNAHNAQRTQCRKARNARNAHIAHIVHNPGGAELRMYSIMRVCFTFSIAGCGDGKHIQYSLIWALLCFAYCLKWRLKHLRKWTLTDFESHYKTLLMDELFLHCLCHALALLSCVDVATFWICARDDEDNSVWCTNRPRTYQG